MISERLFGWPIFQYSPLIDHTIRIQLETIQLEEFSLRVRASNSWSWIDFVGCLDLLHCKPKGPRSPHYELHRIRY